MIKRYDGSMIGWKGLKGTAFASDLQMNEFAATIEIKSDRSDKILTFGRDVIKRDREGDIQYTDYQAPLTSQIGNEVLSAIVKVRIFND